MHTYGITHIDTADAYGPHTAEHLNRDALYPYPDHVLIAPLDAGSLARAAGIHAPLRWLLDRGDHTAPIPSTSRPQHLEQIVAAVAGEA
ncbi:hypothetical protein [Streptomyces sp. NPDC053560]|uniref:hypothetical protein n=1 Tax=Streptomyces sp. NPDC053560 TaxID=3365711 RepID=UPI0037D94E19